MALGFPGHMAAGIGSSPLRMMGGAGSPSADGSNFFARSGLGNNFADFAQGLRGVTSNFAAGFARDPAVREQAAYTAQGIEAQQADTRRQILEWSFGNLDKMIEGLKGAGTLPPATQAMLDKSFAHLERIGVPADIIDEARNYAQIMITTPQAPGEANFQQFYNPQTQQSLAVNVGDPNAVAQAQAQGFTSLGSPESSDVLSPERFQQDLAKAAAGRSSSTTKIENIGSIPQDYQLVRDEQGRVIRMDVIPGSKTARELEDLDKKEQTARTQEAVQGDIVVQDVGRAIAEIENNPIPVAGVGSLLSGVPGTAQRDVAGLLQSIRSNVGFDQLQKMRAASPTGGALGPVSDAENALLQSVLGSLEQSQSGEQLKENLKRVRETYLDVIHGPNRPRVSETEVPEPQVEAVTKDESKLTVQDVDKMTPEQVDAIDVTKIRDNAVLRRILELSQ